LYISAIVKAGTTTKSALFAELVSFFLSFLYFIYLPLGYRVVIKSPHLYILKITKGYTFLREFLKKSSNLEWFWIGVNGEFVPLKYSLREFHGIN